MDSFIDAVYTMITIKTEPRNGTMNFKGNTTTFIGNSITANWWQTHPV